jgi:hypothetical protein
VSGAEGTILAVWLAVWVLIMALVVAGVAVGLWAAIDAGRRPDHQFVLSGENKTLWIVLPLACLGACQPAAVVAGLVYLIKIRPRLDAVPLAPLWPVPPWPPPPPGPGFGWSSAPPGPAPWPGAVPTPGPAAPASSPGSAPSSEAPTDGVAEPVRSAGERTVGGPTDRHPPAASAP